MMRIRTIVLGLCLVACNAKVRAGMATCASVEAMHPGVEVLGMTGAGPLARAGRVEVTGRVRTAEAGRAVVRTDDGLELHMAGASELRFVDGRAIVERGRVFVSSWGDSERTLGVGADVVLHLSDASLEVERLVPGGPTTRVIAVRGGASYQQGSRQGGLSQGESLEGDASLALHPVGVWDDWTGGADAPQGVAHRGSQGVGMMRAHVGVGEAPSPLAINELKVSVRITGDLVLTIVDQRFFNGSEQVAPVEYRARLPEGALVAGFRSETNDRWSTAVPGAIATTVHGGEGVSGLVATSTGEVYAHLGSLAPGATAHLELTYVEWLTHDGAQRTWVYPVGDPVAPQNVGEFSLDVDVSDSGAAVVRAPDGAQLASDGHLRLRRSDWQPRGDLAVDLFDAKAPAVPEARAWESFSRTEQGARHVMFDLSLPAPAPRGSDVAIVVDTSAATDTGSLEIARAAVDALLHQLGPDDRAALLFGDLGARAVEGEAGRMAAVTPAHREAILDAIAHARPGGASDLSRMLVEAHATLDPSRNGSVLYLGDATPTVGALDTARLVDQTTRQAPDLRLYALTLGVSSHPEVLRPLTVDGGLCMRVDDQPEAIAAVRRIGAHALRSCLRDVVLRVGDTVTHPLPTRTRAWVVGDALRMLGELPDTSVPKEITVTARDGTQTRHWKLPVRMRRVADRGDLARRWASERIAALALTGTGRASIAELGARYGVVTPVSALMFGVGTLSEGGYSLDASPWHESSVGYRLPSLGVARSLSPRGVVGVGELREAPIAVDDDSGWERHRRGEGNTIDAQSMLGAALAAAEPAALACVERKRALRPSLGGHIVVRASVDGAGRVIASDVLSSSLGDAETEGCIRRAVMALTVPEPALLGAGPGEATRHFDFASPGGVGPAARRCAATATLPRATRRALWRERLSSRGTDGSAATAVWEDAIARCELRWWEDRVALLELVLEEITDPSQVVRFYESIKERAASDWLAAAITRRYGPAWVWRSYAAHASAVNWDALLARLAAPGVTPAQRVALLRAWLAVVPRDIDLRLRLMAAYEEAGQGREARALAERLRRDPLADARVRAQVAEMILRTNDRVEAMRAFTEIAEFAPYDPYARGRLSDLLLAYGWPDEALHHAQTLAMLRPGDAVATLRVAVAALASGHEDEGLRLLRRSAEEAGGDVSGRVAQFLLDGEVARVAARRPDDVAVRAWLRTAGRLRGSRDVEMALRWTHPDLGVELLARAPSETTFTAVGEVPAALGVRLWSPDALLDGTRLVVRAPVGLRGARTAEARVQVLAPGERGTRLIEEVLRFDRLHRAYGFVVRGGALVAEPVAPSEVPAEDVAFE